MLDWLHQLHSPDGIRAIIAAGGLLVLTGVIFAETGILAGFFLPGDSLLVTAGVLCALDPTAPGKEPLLDLGTTMAVLCVAAVLGDWANYWMGRLAGTKVWSWPDGRFYKRRYLEEAHAFYEKRGGVALAGCRFIPIARTFVPFAAGMARMPFRGFMLWNVLGAAMWVCSLLLLGWWLGGNETMRHNLHLLILAVIGISFIPLVVGAIKRLLRKEPAVPLAPLVEARASEAPASREG
jgi:membrane-associated protein